MKYFTDQSRDETSISRHHNPTAGRVLCSITALLFLSPTLFAQLIYDTIGFGARGDGVTDDTRAVQAAINAAHATDSGLVYFPLSSDCYMVSGLTFYSNITYAGEAQQVCIKSISSKAALVGTPTSAPFSNAVIANLTFDGNTVGATGRDCLELRGPTNVTITHITTTHCGEDGIYVTGWGVGANPAGTGDGLLITNVTSSYNGRNGLSIITGRNITVRDSLFEHHTISGPFTGVDIEPNTALQAVENITFENSVFRYNAYNGFTVWETQADRPYLNLRLINCAFQGNGRDGAYIAARAHLIEGIYISGLMSGNSAHSGYHGGLSIWNAGRVTVTNLSITGATQAVFLSNTNDVTIANSTLSGSVRDLNTNQSTNVRLYATALSHQAASGVFLVNPGAAPRIATTDAQGATAGLSYFQSLAATGDPTMAWAVVAGSLPPGLSLSNTGIISGTPLAVGSFTFTARAANTITYDEKSYTLRVSGADSAPWLSPRPQRRTPPPLYPPRLPQTGMHR